MSPPLCVDCRDGDLRRDLAIRHAPPLVVDGRVGAVRRGAPRVAVDDRGESLCGEAPPQALHLPEGDAEQLRGVEGGELIGTEAGQDFSAAKLSSAQSQCPHTEKYDDIIAEQLSATFSLSSNTTAIHFIDV
jgi:hypothetical protein